MAGQQSLWTKSFIKKKILELLSDTENYTEIPNNKDDNIMKKIEKLTDEHKYELNKNEIDYIQNFNYKTSNFYGLSKIHKSEIIKSAFKQQNSEYVKFSPPTNLKIRPIVAGLTSLTHRLCNSLDLILIFFWRHVASYIRTKWIFSTTYKTK